MLLIGSIFGAISSVFIIPGLEFENVYNFVENEMSELILLVILPILIFDSSRKLNIEDIKKETVPIFFLSIIGVIMTIFFNWLWS